MREVSPTMLQAMLAPETGEAPIVLLTISHASLATPIRVAGYDQDVTSRGETFVAYPFEITLPTDSGEAAPRARLSIDNVDRSIVAAVRQATGTPPQVTIEVILASSPDTLEASFPVFELRNVKSNALTVDAELTFDGLASEPYPAGRFTPAAFPGVH